MGKGPQGRKRSSGIGAVAVLTLVLAAATAAGQGGPAGTGAPADPEPPGRHLYTVPSDGQAEAVLAASDARVVARYGSFTLVEAEGEDATRLRRAGADRRDDMREVTLGDRSINPARERGSLAGRRGGPAGTGLAVVQFVGPIKDAWLERLRATEVRVVTYMAQNGYLVHGSEQELERAAALLGSDPAVRAVVPFTRADKLSSRIRSSATQRVAVQTLSGGDGAGVRRRLAGAGAEVRAPSAVGPYRTQYLRLDATELVRLAADPGVVSVQPTPRPKLLDERANHIVAGLTTGDPLVPTTPSGYFAFHEGLGLGTATFGFTVDVTDEGIDEGTPATTHADFHEGGVLANPTRLDYVDDFTSDPDATDCGGHGTINASIIGGFNTSTGAANEDAEGFNYGLGVAPRVQLGGSKIFLCDSGDFDEGVDLSQLTENAYTKGARISNNSWGTDNFGAYDIDSFEYDTLVRDADDDLPGNQEMVEVFAAGNAGPGDQTIGSPATGKNVIAVGASEGVRASGTDGCSTPNSGADDAEDVIDFSSRGPAADGRVKPDIVAPGTHITGAQTQTALFNGSGVCNAQFPASSTLYSLSSGTSHSTPVVSGVAALLREWYRINEGGGTAVPSPAMTKAILLNAATDIAGGEDGAGGTSGAVPNDVQGWGLANLPGSLDAAPPRVFRDQQDMFGSTGETFSDTYAVQDSGQPVRVTLAWTDEPGPIGSSASYVNDLNLTVDADASYKGNVVSEGQSVPGGSADIKNNVESVYLPAGFDGNFSVEVTAANIVGDGVPGPGDPTDQDFALVVSNAATTTAPVLGHRTTTVTPASGTLDPGEGFTVSEQIENSGNAGAVGINGTLTGPPIVGVSDDTTAWADLGAGLSGTNSDPLVGSLGAGAVCGAPLQLDLDIVSSAGMLNVPIELNSGAAGSAVVRNSTHVPRSIPDADPDGIGSTLAVQETGRIKDVNVRIGSLTHTWVGDLKLDIVAPDGTTVNLASSPGGPDNDGNNFTNVVFDDEAAEPIGDPGGYTGSFKPQFDQLSRLDGKEQQGFWTLRVADVIADLTGTLNSWGNDISRAECSPAGGQAPGVVQGLTATAGLESVALDWDDTAGAGGYEIFRRDADGGYSSDPVGSPIPSDFADTGLAPGVNTCYRVRALGDNGSGELSSEVCATPQGAPPGAIAGLTASGGQQTVSLDWNDTPAAAQYFVFRRSSGGGYPAMPTATVTQSQHVDSGRTAGVEECYRVQAANTFGSGPQSGEACATPSGEEPEIPVLPKLDLSGLPGTVRVNRRGRYTISFDTNRAGSLTLTTVRAFAAARKKKQTLAKRGFGAPSNGVVKLRLKLRKKHLSLLKRKKTLRVSLSVEGADDLAAKRRFKLKAPKPKKRS